MTPSAAPSLSPTSAPSDYPTANPSITPSAAPTSIPSRNPSATPSSVPSLSPTRNPTRRPTLDSAVQPDSSSSTIIIETRLNASDDSNDISSSTIAIAAITCIAVILCLIGVIFRLQCKKENKLKQNYKRNVKRVEMTGGTTKDDNVSEINDDSGMVETVNSTNIGNGDSFIVESDSDADDYKATPRGPKISCDDFEVIGSDETTSGKSHKERGEGVVI